MVRSELVKSCGLVIGAMTTLAAPETRLDAVHSFGKPLRLAEVSG